MSTKSNQVSFVLTGKFCPHQLLAGTEVISEVMATHSLQVTIYSAQHTIQILWSKQCSQYYFWCQNANSGVLLATKFSPCNMADS